MGWQQDHSRALRAGGGVIAVSQVQREKLEAGENRGVDFVSAGYSGPHSVPRLTATFAAVALTVGVWGRKWPLQRGWDSGLAEPRAWSPSVPPWC